MLTPKRGRIGMLLTTTLRDRRDDSYSGFSFLMSPLKGEPSEKKKAESRAEKAEAPQRGRFSLACLLTDWFSSGGRRVVYSPAVQCTCAWPRVLALGRHYSASPRMMRRYAS